MPDQAGSPITDIVVQMYKLGTGDCFVLKFRSGDEVTFKMLIDCGCWSGKYAEKRPFITTLKQEVGGHLDALVVTHEHKDHVYGFAAGKRLFTDGFQVDRLWMAWTEDDDDDDVKAWKKAYGQKRRALAEGARRLQEAFSSPSYDKQLDGMQAREAVMALHQGFAARLEAFVGLHLEEEGPMGARTYVNALKGMKVVKEDLDVGSTTYFKPGDVITGLPGLPGIRIFVLGPPQQYASVRQETGAAGEAYAHNKDLDETDLFVRAMAHKEGPAALREDAPFEHRYALSDGDPGGKAAWESYEKDDWRRIDHDWLLGTGALALRMNSLTNNLSLVLAIEVIETGQVLLFPGDAEIGSWTSWHAIDWQAKGFDGLKTEDLLRRTVFYKVAHHLSHNGTARSLGLDLMTSPDLSAMATLDYSVISEGWTTTMPNRKIVSDLLEKTRGRLMIMSETGLFFDRGKRVPLSDKIKAYRSRMGAEARAAFDAAYDNSDPHYMQYVVKVNTT